MQALEAQVFGYEPFSEEYLSSMESVERWVGRKWVRYSKLGGQSLILGLDAVFFLGKVEERFPERLTKASLSLLNGVGFISVPFTVHYACKSFNDARSGYGSGNFAIMAMGGARVVELVSSLGLFGSAFVASTAGLCGQEALQGAIYKAMIPWGEGTLFLTIGLTALSMLMDYRALKKLQPDFIDERASALIEAFNNDLKGESADSVEDKRVVSHLRFCMDKDTLQEFLELSGTLTAQAAEAVETKRALLRIIEKNIRTQQNINFGGQFALILIGYVFLAIEKYYTPNSAQSAAINLFIAAGYTLKLLIEVQREVVQRRSLRQAVEESFTTSVL